MGLFSKGFAFNDEVVNNPVTTCFTSAGTWTCPTGAQKIVVVTIGAGGGGGGGITPASTSCYLTTGAGGGGGGGVSCCELTGVAIPASACVSIGSGGGGGLNNGSNGGGGGASIFCYGACAVCGGGGAGGEGGCNNLTPLNTIYTSSGGNGGLGNYLNGGVGGCGYAFRCTSPVSTDVNGRDGTFPTGNGGRPGGGGGGFYCAGNIDGTPGLAQDDTVLTICSVSVTLGVSGQGADYTVCTAQSGSVYAAGGGGGASPGNYIRSCGGAGSQGFVFVKAFF
jgi:hypothetical protein